MMDGTPNTFSVQFRRSCGLLCLLAALIAAILWLASGNAAIEPVVDILELAAVFVLTTAQ
jgi:hypothetical protein